MKTSILPIVICMANLTECVLLSWDINVVGHPKNIQKIVIDHLVRPVIFYAQHGFVKGRSTVSNQQKQRWVVDGWQG
jgi:hypothetical protein